MQNPEAERTRVFARRLLLLGGVKVAAFSVLAARLHQLQVVDAPRFALQAEENRVSQRLLSPARGRILDRAGHPLAINVPVYRVWVVREQARDVEAVLRQLKNLITISDERLAEVVAQSRSRAAFVPVTVRDDLTWDEVAAVAVNAPDLPGIVLDAGLVRRYEHGREFAHVLGYVGPVSEAELTGSTDALLRVPDLRIGKNGVERSYDDALRGRAGLLQVEVNAMGREIREIRRRPGARGQDAALTIDRELQRYAHRRLASELSASAVILDVNTGAILAMVSVPSFTPDAFVNGVSHAQWNEWRDDPRAPLVNKAIGGQYPPGSTFKMMTALAALEMGIVDGSTNFYCPGHLSMGRARFHCWRSGGHGALSVVQALAQSCDVYFYELGKRVGIDKLAAMCRRFGLGAPTGLDLPNEQPGLIPTRAWKEATIGEPWQPGESVVCAIGQGYVSTTPLQLAVMTARIANGGFAVEPWLVHEPLGRARSPAPPPSIGVSPTSLELARLGMFEVVNGKRGTARAQKLLSETDQMAGKTGTSQVKRITRAERAAGLHKRKDRPWRDRHHALFVAYAPYLAPRYAVSVVVEHGGSGSAAAAPIARDLMQKALDLDPSRRSLELAHPRPLVPTDAS